MLSAKNFKIAQTLVSAKLRSIFYKNKTQQFIANEFAKIPGLPFKAAQILGYHNNTNSESTPLSEQILSFEEITQIIAKTNPQFYKMNSWSSQANMHSASLGQVIQTQQYAVKVQYPNIAQELSDEIGLVLKAFKGFNQSRSLDFDFELYSELLPMFLQKELNYCEELKNQIVFYNHFKNHKSMVVPQSFPEYSGPTLLVQTYHRGLNFEQTQQLNLSLRNHCAEQLVGFYFESLFNLKKVHADLHQNNFSYDSDNKKLIIYDFGSVLNVEPEFVESFLQLLQNDQLTLNQYRDAWINLGFDSAKVNLLSDLLPILTQVIFEPLFSDRDFDLAEWNLSVKLNEVLKERRWLFRTAGSPWFLFFMKSIFSLAQSLQSLKVKINFHQLLKNFIKTNQLGSQRLLTAAPKNEIEINHIKYPTNVNLKVMVTENGQAKVNLTMPISALEDLEYLMPKQVIANLKNAKVDLKNIYRMAHDNNYKPMVLFNHQHENRRYLVSIEAIKS